MLEVIAKYSTETTGMIHGNELCFLHDRQLMSMAMSQNTNQLFNRTALGKCLGKPSDSFYTDMFMMQDINPVLLPSPDFFETYIDASYEYGNIYKKIKWKIGIVHVFGILCLLETIGCVILLFQEFFGIGLFMVGFWGLLTYLFEGILRVSIKRRNKTKLGELAKTCKEEYKTAAGYVAIRKKRLEKKDVLNSFLRNFS